MMSVPSFYLAPLQGYTNVFYRKALAMTSANVDKYFTPFFEEGKQSFTDPDFFPELHKELTAGMITVPQVATHSPEFLVSFTRQMLQLGYDEININMGCPFPMLVKRQKGGGILKHPALIDQLLSAFFAEDLPVRLSVKMRAGFDNVDDGLNVLKVLNRFSLSEVIIHPRLVTQKYEGQPDWDAFELILNECSHAVIGNGDINGTDDLTVLTQRFPGVNGWMLGRGALCRPWIYEEAKSQKQVDNNRFLKELHDNYFTLVTDYFDDWYRAFNYLMAFWKYPLENVENGKRLYRKLKKHNKPEDYQSWLISVWLTID